MTALTISPPVSSSRLNYLDSLRAIAVVLVIGIHALSYVLDLSLNQRIWLSLGLTTVAVPIFFLADGYLLARGVERKAFSYAAFISNSVKRLLVPWFLFTVLYTLCRYILERAGVFPDYLIVGASAPLVALKAYGAVFSAQLYFLFSLFVIRLFSSLFVRLYRLQSAAVFYLVSLAVIVSGNLCLTLASPYLAIPNGQEPILHAIWGVQFYVLGLVLARAGEALISKPMLALQALIFFTMLFLYKGLSLDSHIFLQYAALLFMFSAMMKINPDNRVLNYIGTNTMEIYLLHSPVILKAVSMAAVFIGLGGIAGFGITVVITLMLSLLAANILKRLPFGPMLFGVFGQKS
ncbi:MAG: hypothetical protein CME36_12195 [unclassified Hahellaceae]|nr:hypothetical protein [Hahellaceae bacterium]|tara:strand:+ start:140208 stop:141254 length:1047 start_codon:yes stop_codon:yes gene_type:complete